MSVDIKVHAIVVPWLLKCVLLKGYHVLPMMQPEEVYDKPVDCTIPPTSIAMVQLTCIVCLDRLAQMSLSIYNSIFAKSLLQFSKKRDRNHIFEFQ